MPCLLSWFASRYDCHWIDQVIFLVRLHVIHAVVLVVFWTFCTPFGDDEVVVLRQILAKDDLSRLSIHTTQNTYTVHHTRTHARTVLLSAC